MTRPNAAGGGSVTPVSRDSGSRSLPSGSSWPGVSWWDRFFLLRPLLLIPVWTFYLLGSRSARSLAGEGEWRWRPEAAELHALLLVSLLVGAAYIVNQLVDAEADEINRKLFLIPSGLVSRRSAIAEAALLAGAAGLGAWRWAAAAEAVLLAATLLLGLAYSLAPVRLKARPGLDVLAHAGGFGIIFFLLGWVGAGGAVGPAAFFRAAPYGLATGAVFLVSTLEDLPGDLAAGLETSGTRLGGAGVRRCAAGLAVLTLAVAVPAGEWPGVIWAGVCVPLYLWLWLRGGTAQGFLVNQLSGRLMVLTAVPGCAALAGAVGVLYLACRFYYRKRFGLAYPRLSLAGAGGGH